MAASFGGGGLVLAVAARSCDGLTGRSSTFGSTVTDFSGRGGEAMFPAVLGAVALKSFWVAALPSTRKILSLILRLRYSTIAGCQSA